jgi:hypothetical protein
MSSVVVKNDYSLPILLLLLVDILKLESPDILQIGGSPGFGHLVPREQEWFLLSVEGQGEGRGAEDCGHQ